MTIVIPSELLKMTIAAQRHFIVEPSPSAMLQKPSDHRDLSKSHRRFHDDHRESADDHRVELWLFIKYRDFLVIPGAVNGLS